MTRSVLPLLAKEGVQAISVGVNGASKPPNVRDAWAHARRDMLAVAADVRCRDVFRCPAFSCGMTLSATQRCRLCGTRMGTCRMNCVRYSRGDGTM